MASVMILGRKDTDINYSLVNGRIRSFTLDGKILYDEDSYISVYGWKQKLCKLIINTGLNKKRKGHGLFAFVYKLSDEGRL